MHLVGLIGTLFFAQLLCAQNLVPNPSFENYDSCPRYNGDLFCIPWYSPTVSTPDYFNECWNESWNDNMDVPINRFGAEAARSGVAYAGIYTQLVTVNAREYITIRLFDSLKAGSKYCVEFYVSLGDSSWGGVNFLGAHLSSTPDTMYAGFNMYNLPFQPQIEYDSIMNDTSGWTKISGLYIALGGECYLTIGVFKPDSLLTYDSIQGDGSVKFTYYFIDDVSVWQCDTPETVYPAITFYPNPCNGNFIITGNFPFGSELKIYNMLGQQVSNTIYLPEGNAEVPIYSFLAQGVYCCRIESQAVVLKSEMIVVTE